MKYILTFIFACGLTHVFGQIWFGQITDQSKKVINLASNYNSTTRSTIEANKEYSFIIINKIPTEAYDIQINIEDLTVDPITTPPELQGIRKSTLLSSGAPTCAEFTALFEQIYESIDEQELRENIKNLDIKIKQKEIFFNSQPNSTDDEGCIAEQIQDGKNLLNKTVIDLGKYTLSENQILTITVKRFIGKKEVSWTYVYTTFTKKGTWRTLYGFTAISTRFPFKESSYYLRDQAIAATATTAASTEYVITKDSDRKYAELATAVFFTWIDNKKLNNKWISSWSGGLGFDLQAPVLYFGRQHTYHENICMSYGLAFTQQKRLAGRYKPNQIISENLTDDQLHTKIYVPNIYFGLFIRFNENPIQSKRD